MDDEEREAIAYKCFKKVRHIIKMYEETYGYLPWNMTLILDGEEFYCDDEEL
jgi:hypothetical protein